MFLIISIELISWQTYYFLPDDFRIKKTQDFKTEKYNPQNFLTEINISVKR